ncbi:MAG: helix-turn-helix transcriptional regulator [Sphingobacteriaceae bacterium]|nr:helix-turn-helix transcriptional regulator [Sphingobacteriaceae bacterium]
MYIETAAETYTDARKGIIERLHVENKQENFILNTKFKQCYFPSHAENLSLKFTFSGNEYYEYGRKRVEVRPANFLIINQGQEHASWIESENWVNSFAIYFTSDFVSSVITDLKIADEKLVNEPFNILSDSGSLNFFQNLFPFTPDFVKEVGRFKQFLEETGGRESLLIDERLRNIFLKFIKTHQCGLSLEIKRLDAIKLSTRVEILKRLHIARDLMESFYLNSLTIHDISQACFLSENLLMRYFKLVYKQSPHQYIINKRLEFAKEQLLYTNNTFNEITYASGFECPSSFGRLFKEKFGLTPNELRKDNLFQRI